MADHRRGPSSTTGSAVQDGILTAPVIEVENLVKTFDGNHEVLRGISFTVNKGETVVILGRSGTGKSVTLKILIGLLTRTSGIARVQGRQLGDLSERDALPLRRNIGYVFQGGALFDSLTILENVGFQLYQQRLPDEEIRDRVLKRLKMVGLAHTLDKYPSELSGGMQKRAALARAIIDLPEIVFYDEPTSGLDPLTTDVINQIILRLRSSIGVTSIVVTHDIKSAFTIADRIIMLDQGRIVIEGTPAEVANSDMPWVQHFIQGQALEGEMIESGAFRTVGSTTRVSRSKALSGRRIAIKPGEAPGRYPMQDAATGDSGARAVPRAIRNVGSKSSASGRRPVASSSDEQIPSSTDAGTAPAAEADVEHDQD